MRLALMMLASLAIAMVLLPLLALGADVSPSVPQVISGTGTGAISQAAADEDGDTAPSQADTADTPHTRVVCSGVFRILDRTTGKVEEVGYRDYVRGALCAEMPPDFHPEALKAQAVAAHTYALCCQMQQSRSPDSSLQGADFSADPQNWQGYVTEEQAREAFGDQFELYWGRICAAADAVCNYAILYEQEPIVAAYHAINTGMTEHASNVWIGSAPYLVPVESFGDTLAPDQQTTVSLPLDEARSILENANSDIELPEDPAQWIEVSTRSQGGYVLEADVGGQSMKGTELRELFGLRSACFSVEAGDGQLIFQVTGYGHGVGMSQYGADYMARQGADFAEILAHYYPGTELATVETTA